MYWVLGFLLIWVFSQLAGSGLLAFASYLLLLVYFCSRFLAWHWANGLRIERKMKCRIAEVGEKVRVKVRISYQGVIPIPWVILEDLLPESAIDPRHPFLKLKGKRFKVLSLFSMQSMDFTYQLECLHRGFYQIGPVLAETGDPFGFMRKYRVGCEPFYLLVLPKIVPLLGYDLTSRRPIGEIRMTLKVFEDPTRIAGIREYEPGDPMSRIHWKASARSGVFQCKVFEPSCLAGAMILLDFHEAMFPPRGEPFRSELAVDTAVALTHAVCVLNQPFGIATNATDAAFSVKQSSVAENPEADSRAEARTFMLDASRPNHLQPLFLPSRRGIEHLQLTRQMLGRAIKSDSLKFAQMIQEVAAHLPRDLTLVAILSGVTEEAAMALGNLKQQGFAVSAVLVQLDEEGLNRAFKRLVSNGIREIRHVENSDELPQMCRSQIDRTSPLSLA
ncbi:MAG: DUF58 domain-containing protein [Planctomycetia bacterium]